MSFELASKAIFGDHFASDSVDHWRSVVSYDPQMKQTFAAMQPLLQHVQQQAAARTSASGSVEPIVVSVVVCTRNRATMLEATILSLVGQDFDPNKYEIIVVDNASEDGTGDLIDSYSAKTQAPQIRHIYEGRLGSSSARNAGWRAARGHYVAYVDDDESADQGWLRSLLATFEEDVTCAAAVGGAVRLDWGGERPNWLPGVLERLYSPVDLGSTTRLLSDQEYPLTANVAILRELYDRLGGFRTDLGHVGNLPFGGEDIEMMNRIRSHGGKIYYEPKAVVYHHIPKERVRRTWILLRCFAGGMSGPILDRSQSVKVRDILYNGRMAMIHMMRALVALLRNHGTSYVENGASAALRLGRATRQIQMLLEATLRRIRRASVPVVE